MRLSLFFVLILAGCTTSESSGSTTTPPHDGAIGADGGDVTVLSDGRAHPHCLVLHGESLYWIEQDTAGTVMRMPKSGGAPTTITTGCGAFALAVDDTNVYCNGLDKSIRATTIASGATTTLTTSQPVSGLAVDAKNVYWTTYYGDRVDGENYTTSLLTIPIAGGAFSALATKQPLASSIAVDADAEYFLTLSQADPTRASTGTWLMKSTLGSTTPTPLAKDDATANDTPGANALVIDATTAYWTADSFVHAAPLAGGSVRTLATIPGGIGTAYAVAIDDGFAYFSWSNPSGPTGLSKVPKVGGDATTLVMGEIGSMIVVDDSFVYWVSEAAGRISKTPK
jgi:hypothetical protein